MTPETETERETESTLLDPLALMLIVRQNIKTWAFAQTHSSR